MKLRTVRRVAFSLWVVMALCVLMIYALESMVFAGIALAAIAADLVIRLRFWRCPECGSFLGRSMWPRYCRHCGEQLDV